MNIGKEICDCQIIAINYGAYFFVQYLKKSFFKIKKK